LCNSIDVLCCFKNKSFTLKIFFISLYFLCAFQRQLLANESPLIQETILDSLPRVLDPPAGINIKNYEVYWISKAIPDFSVQFVEESFEWVRLKNRLAIPRARLVIKSSSRNKENGSVYYADKVYPFQDEEIEVPIALISNVQNQVQIKIYKNNKWQEGKIGIRFANSQQLKNIYFDPSCANYSPHIDQLNVEGWAYVVCSLQVARRKEKSFPNIYLKIFWDQSIQEVQKDLKSQNSLFLNDSLVEAEDVSLWSIGLTSLQSKLNLKSFNQKEKWTISFNLPEQFHLGHFGMGLGPYAYTLQDGTGSVESFVPLVTLYFSYSLAEKVRLVSFNATSIYRNPTSDLGVYLLIDQFEFLDQKVKFHLLLGGHSLFFKARNQYYTRFSLPQGFELVYKNFLKERTNLGLGGFFYPVISGRSYFNLWLRWGGAHFIEFNFISFQEPMETFKVYSKSMGLSVGMPLFDF